MIRTVGRRWMKVLRKIEYVAHVNESDEVLYIDLEIDGHSFRMDRQDVYELYSIANTAFDRMLNPDEVEIP